MSYIIDNVQFSPKIIRIKSVLKNCKSQRPDMEITLKTVSSYNNLPIKTVMLEKELFVTTVL